jgi:sterol desaturase/sphingolipid hydroxylase (fatty acid hydroxylase superfamily)
MRMNDFINSAAALLSGPNGIWVIAAYYYAMVIGERVWYALQRPGQYDNIDGLANWAVNTFNNLFAMFLAVLVPFSLYGYAFEHWRIADFSGTLLGFALAFLAHEQYYYWTHRLSHRVGLFWAVHTAHHSSNEFNFTVAARGTLIDGLMMAAFIWPAAVLGISPVQFFSVVILKNMFGIFNHSRYFPKIAALDSWVATPSNHRVHHGTQAKYIDKNYSQVLIIWDRLFGTFQREEEEPVYGLVKRFESKNPIDIELQGFRWLIERVASADRWQDKLAYVFMPPEWSHDGVCRSDCVKGAPAHQGA